MSQVSQNGKKQPKAPKEFVSFSSQKAISDVSAELLCKRAHLDQSHWIISYSMKRLHKMHSLKISFKKGWGDAEKGEEGINLRKHRSSTFTFLNKRFCMSPFQ